MVKSNLFHSKAKVVHTGLKAIKQLQDSITQTEYDRYIKKLSFNEQSSTSSTYLYEAPNLIISRWINTKYKQRLEDILEQLTKKRITVNVKIKQSVQEQPNLFNATVLDQKTKRNKQNAVLNPSLNFESFVVGASNEFAYSAAMKVAKQPGKIYNPLFLYGGVGLGKTHLLEAIGNFNVPYDYDIMYLTTEHLMNDFTKHLTQKNMNAFKEKYRNYDILLIDDVQFLAGKEVFQEEFFHTFNELVGKNKQVVLTADKKPSEIVGLEERLQSRFAQGLAINIQPPELETKIGIIKKKCEIDSISLSNDIILHIATHLETNIREIEGILIQINAYANLINLEEITIEFVQNILKEHIREKQESVTVDLIVETVAKELNIKPSEIKSKSRSKNITYARRVVIYLARELTHDSMPYLANYFGMKDHSAISHNIKKTKTLLKTHQSHKDLIETIKQKINKKS